MGSSNAAGQLRRREYDSSSRVRRRWRHCRLDGDIVGCFGTQIRTTYQHHGALATITTRSTPLLLLHRCHSSFCHTYPSAAPLLLPHLSFCCTSASATPPCRATICFEATFTTPRTHHCHYHYTTTTPPLHYHYTAYITPRAHHHSTPLRRCPRTALTMPTISPASPYRHTRTRLYNSRNIYNIIFTPSSGNL